VGSGTSFSSPFVAGAAVLVRQAGGSNMSAIQAKAILLNTTKVISGTANEVGLGALFCSQAVGATLAGHFDKASVSTAAPVQNFDLQIGAGFTSVTIAWMRSNVSTSATDNLDLRIYNSQNQLVGQSTSAFNAYEKVIFNAGNGGLFRAEVRAVSLVSGSREFAIAGQVRKVLPQPPVLTSMTPTSGTNLTRPVVTINGQNLSTVTKVTFGSVDVNNLTIVNDTQIQVTPPFPLALGQVSVTATNPAATSNPLTYTYGGEQPAVLAGPNFLVSNQTFAYSIYSQKSFVSLVWISPFKLGSKAPGIIDLEIGNNFNSLFILDTVGLPANGFNTFNITIPPNSNGLQFHLETVNVDLTNLTFPLDTSNALSINVIF
jgi:hypothetical protein